MNLHVVSTLSINGEVTMPRSKTHSFRALVLASLADGISIVRQPKLSNDWLESVRAMRLYGAKINEIENNVFQVEGVAGNPQTPSDIINVNNSGTMLFFIAGVAAACPGISIITGDESIRTLRKISKNLFQPFGELGVEIISTKGDGMAPLVIKGKVNGGVAHMDGTGCQPVFSVLVASALSSKPVEIFVTNPGETAYIDLLLFWFTKVGIRFENVGNTHTHYIFSGNTPPKAFDTVIPLEWSAPAYPLLAALLLRNSKITVNGMDFSDPYGDKFVIDILQKMGGDITSGDSLTARSSTLHGVEVDMNKLPDQVPTIAVAACFAIGKTIIKNALTARWKECDRISALCSELNKMGAHIEEKKDGLVIAGDEGKGIHGASVNGHMDHRMVLSLAVAGLAAHGTTVISDALMLEKSFETFIPDMMRAGANFELKENI